MTDRLREILEGSPTGPRAIGILSPDVLLAFLDLRDLVRQDIANGRCWPEAEVALARLEAST